MNERRTIDNYADLKNWYDSKYSEMNGCWFTPPQDCNRHLDALGVPLDKSLYLLDIGCGGGHFLNEAMKRVSCVGIEPSEKAIEFSKRHLGEQVGPGSLLLNTIEEMASYPQKFHFITSIGSLEHVLDLDEALRVIHILLKPNGKFYNFAPNLKWVHEDQPNELRADPEWWTAKLAEHGLIVERVDEWNDSNAYVCKWGMIL